MHKKSIIEATLIQATLIQATLIHQGTFNRNYLKACVRYFLPNFYFLTKWRPVKNYEKCFLFYLKSSFRS